jgi:hypothetical protein
VNLRFNTLLEVAGLNPKTVFLLRHEDGRLAPGRIFSAWLSERKKFESYQQSQKWKNRFPEGSAVASFVVAPGGETLFVGLYNVMQVSRITGPFNDALLGSMPPEDRAWHEMRHSHRMQEYEAKLVIDWGQGFKAWRQLARKQNKVVLEIRAQLKEEQFPGYINFMRPVAALPRIPREWQDRLKEAKGVYLLTFSDGQQYVGSAAGDEGFWRRWSDYVRNGHGNNRVLIRESRDARRDAMISILEITGSASTKQDVIKREMIWQEKLGSRAKRLDDQ